MEKQKDSHYENECTFLCVGVKLSVALSTHVQHTNVQSALYAHVDLTV
jgi:hypothetical protein